jgi:hypothetical protein
MSGLASDAVALLAARRSRRVVLRHGALGGVAALGTGLGARAVAQNATPAPEEVAILFVQADFAAGTLEPTPGDEGAYTLSLTGAPSQTVYFSDRPERLVGVVSTPRFLDLLGFSTEDPPNAALVAQVGEAAEAVAVIVLELFAPNYNPVAATLTYEARLLEGFERLEATGAGFRDRVLSVADVPTSVGSCSLFIDSADCTPWDPRC